MQAMQGIQVFEQVLILVVLATAFIALGYAYWLARQTFSADKGSQLMQRVWGFIKDGANAYLRTQLRTIAILIVVLTIAMFLSVALVKPTGEANELFCPADVEAAYALDISTYAPGGITEANVLAALALRAETPKQIATNYGYADFNPERVAARVECPSAVTGVATGRALAFAMGAIFSATVGFMGMNMAVQGNVRVAAASRVSFKRALTIAYRSGTITGMLTDGLGLLGGTLIFIIFGKASPDVLLGFGFGGTLLALFMRVGGGIYTKAADVGADLVGKVEADLPEDDPRNAAVIADLVGDNVGDCAGMAADIFESYEVTIVSSLILGLALTSLTGQLFWIVLPLLVRGIGVVSSIIGTYTVSMWKVDDAEEAMYKSYEISSAITIISTFLLAVFYAGAQDPGGDLLSHLSLGAMVAIGVALAVAFNPLTAFATSAKSPRVQKIAKSTVFGPALVILEGVSLGYMSSVWSAIVIVASILASVLVFSVNFPQEWALPVFSVGALIAVVAIIRGFLKKDVVSGIFQALWIMVFALFLISMRDVGADNRFVYTLFGVTLIGVGMLSHTGNNVSMDTFGPISDNANGIAELAGEDFDDNARQILADLDAAGNTTKAITKGIAIGSAVIAAVSLFGSFFIDIERVMPEERLATFTRSINLADPIVFIGVLLGACLPLIFGSLLIKAVNRAAGYIMAEVRRQLAIPEIMKGERTPDYAQAVSISTRAAQTELIPLGLIAILSPIVIGLLLKEQALGGFLVGVIVSGQLQAVFMANAGGAWDNAKKYIEDGNMGGKGSANHKASVVGDTVGDPFKDTAGPALNPMIKVINLVALIMAPLVVQTQAADATLPVVIISLIGIVLIVLSIRRSDRDTDTVEIAAPPKELKKAHAPAGD
ncbi:sodium-translocating pyrophosphatase [Candidatus Flexifilum breve]|uniref:sodium-translocating pyrophosphatase n=1 Tax=Candidatus Flexifilum breve TaxID=3140694 RepID=UPI0031CC40D3